MSTILFGIAKTHFDIEGSMFFYHETSFYWHDTFCCLKQPLCMLTVVFACWQDVSQNPLEHSSYSPFVHGHRLGFLRQTHVRLLAVLHHFYLIISCSLHHPHYIPHHIVNYITLSQTYMVYPRKIPVYKSPIYIYIIHIYIYIHVCVCLC